MDLHVIPVKPSRGFLPFFGLFEDTLVVLGLWLSSLRDIFVIVLTRSAAQRSYRNRDQRWPIDRATDR